MATIPTSPADAKNIGDASVVELIHQHIDRLTPAERRAARRLLSHYPLDGLEPLAAFAERAGVSHPTILRFIAKLGFGGYAEFQSQLRAELEARLKSPLSKRHEQRDERPTADDFLHKFAATTCENIRQSLASLPRGEFDGAVDLLAGKAGTVYVLGGRFTDPLADYIYRHLRILRPRVQHIVGLPVSWPEYLLDMDRNTVLLAIDIRRYQDEVVRFAQEAAQRKARVILMTDQWLSPIASIAKYVLAARVAVPSNWDSVTALTTFAEALIAALNNRKWEHSQDRIHDLEQLRTGEAGR